VLGRLLGTAGHTMATAHSPAKTHSTPARLMAFWVTGNTSIRAKLASQSTAAAMAAAWPRTAVFVSEPHLPGKTLL
jgi:hypothetical protein